MRLFGWIGGLWRFARASWIDVGMGLRPGSGASALYLFLFLILFVVGLALVLLGFDLGKVDLWLEAHGGLFDSVGTFLFRAVCALVLLLCVYAVAGHFLDRRNPERPGFGCVFLALVVGYFAWFGVIGD